MALNYLICDLPKLEFTSTTPYAELAITMLDIGHSIYKVDAKFAVTITLWELAVNCSSF